jgi:hypothetical protein
MDDKSIAIKAVIQDKAGNYREWQGANSMEIAGMETSDRPMITSATADKENGWWGPASTNIENSPIKITLTANAPEGIKVTGTPSIQLATGSTLTGSAVFVSGSESNSLVFDYIPREGETTLANDNGGALQFKLTNDEAIIDLNGGLMHSLRGNKLIYGDDNTGSPLLPKPNDVTEATGENVKLSLDENKDLKIDGVNPYYVNSSGQQEMDIYNIYLDGSDQRTGYYNYNTEKVRFRFYFRITTNDDVLDDNGERVDMSLASAQFTAADCNAPNCGKIQLQVAAVMVGETPDSYTNFGTATTIRGFTYHYGRHL